MGYENAPQTKMLASHCAACARPLCDAVSVEVGMGPDCREKHGYDARIAELDGQAREIANKLIYQIAIDQEGTNVVAASARLMLLGFGALAERILTRVHAIRIDLDATTDDYVVRTPYDATFVEVLKREVPHRERLFDRQHKAWRVATHAKRGLWTALCTAFAGRSGIGPNGAFVVASR